jgi:hypothetical protein
MSLDGVIDTPTWTFKYSFTPMLADGLVDELHLLVYPLTRGAGPRLFPENAAPGRLSLAACASYDHGVVYMNYRPQPPGPSTSFAGVGGWRANITSSVTSSKMRAGKEPTWTRRSTMTSATMSCA